MLYVPLDKSYELRFLATFAICYRPSVSVKFVHPTQAVQIVGIIYIFHGIR